jgi:hypothetical protein
LSSSTTIASIFVPPRSMPPRMLESLFIAAERTP